MSKRQIILFLGILIALTPFAGVTAQMKNYLTVILGLCVIGVSLYLKKGTDEEKKVHHNSGQENRNSSFVDSNNSNY